MPYNQQRGEIYIPSQAYTAAPLDLCKPVHNPVYDGLVVVLDVTAITATQTVTAVIEGLDPASKKWYTILASAAIAAVSTIVLRVNPNIPASANLIAADMVPLQFRVRMVHNNLLSVTYSVGYNLCF